MSLIVMSSTPVNHTLPRMPFQTSRRTVRTDESPGVALYCYLDYLIPLRSKAGNRAINIEEGPQPVAFMYFYDRVRDGPSVRRGERIHVILVGNAIGVTSQWAVLEAATSGCLDAYWVTVKSLLRAYSVWRYWLRTIADYGHAHPELDQRHVVELCRQNLPSPKALNELVATEFHPDAPPMFAPAQEELCIEIGISEDESTGKDVQMDEAVSEDESTGEDVQMDAVSMKPTDQGDHEDAVSEDQPTDREDHELEEVEGLLVYDDAEA
ncbi:unnamed protein product [Peniophora sp. CBMAI 1063]|nr:unnamed protein product [Peniophora sp. CBMAI 1063]